MKLLISVGLMLVMISVFSCKKQNKPQLQEITKIQISDEVQEIEQETIHEKNENENEKSENEIIENEIVDESKYYHASLTTDYGIDATIINSNWKKIKIMDDFSINKYDKHNMSDDMKVGIEKDLDYDGDLEKIITGTFLDTNLNEGSFLTILNKDNKVIITEIVADVPILVHMRDVGSAIFFGTGYGSEYFRQIVYNKPNIEITYIEADF